MSNPVLNKLSTHWQHTTPAGYPTMPGYQVGTPTPSSTYQGSTPYPAQAPSPSYPQAGYPQSSQPGSYNMGDFECSYNAPAADAVDRGSMTYDDVIIRSATLLAVLIGTAAVSWGLMYVSPGLSALSMLVGGVAALVLALINIFSSTIHPALIVAYAAAEGLALGGLSVIFEFRYPGIVIQALLATAAVFAVTLMLFSSGKVRHSPKMQKFVLIALFGIIAYRLLAWVLTLTGVVATHPDTLTIMGLPLGAVVGVVAVLIGAMSLIGDFDQIQQGVARGVPARFAWMCAFGLMVTIVWMYTEILRLLSYFRD